MDQVFRVLLLLIFGGGAMTALAGAAVYWSEPSRRIGRALRRALEGPADAVITSPSRGQGAALRLDTAKVAIVRGPTDHGLVFGLEELVGAELIFDGHVAARAFRSEQRRPLDRIDPEVGRVTLRLVFDDVRDPDFEFELWNAADPARPGWDGPDAVQAARRFFARIEAVVRH
ncbi:MAG TPA: hypothetical protein VL358_00760 [Caulobacteraceae bacterium]|jgi:hypothetical protein|nr:hypothetical protein [Caulobacteraceae bacterium]